MAPLYGTAPGLLSSKGSRFLFVVANNLAYSLGLRVDNWRENYAETFLNIVQFVYSCHCWLCHSWSCQVQHGMPLFRSLCVLYDVRCSWELWRSSLGMQHHTYHSLDCYGWGKWVFGWWLVSEAWSQVEPGMIVSIKAVRCWEPWAPWAEVPWRGLLLTCMLHSEMDLSELTAALHSCKMMLPEGATSWEPWC